MADSWRRVQLEDVTALAAELQKRRASDPLRGFVLHPKQQLFVRSVLEGQRKENWFIAANRSGKSDAGAYVGATLARFGPPGSPGPTSGWVSALDFPTSRDVIQPKYFDNGFVPPGQAHPPFIPKHEIRSWSSESQVLKLKNGSIIGFKSADSGRSKYQGAEKDWFHMDEEHPWDIYEEAVIRVGSRPLLFFCTATILPPEGQSNTVSWVFDKLIKPSLEGRLPHIGLFGAAIYDNPHILTGEIARLEAIYPEGSLSRRIRLGGEWLPGIGGSRAYGAFSALVHVKEGPPLGAYRPLLWTVDFNVEPMCGLVMQREGERYHVFDELVLDSASIPEMVDLFRDRYPAHNGEIWLFGDATGKRRTSQTGQTDYWVILQEMRTYGSPIRMRVPPENPRVPDRINAVNRLLLDERGGIRLTVEPRCLELIADLEGVLRDQRGGIKKVTNRKDPYFRRTHTSDALGYLVSYEEPVRPPSDRERGSVPIPAPRYGQRS